MASQSEAPVRGAGGRGASPTAEVVERLTEIRESHPFVPGDAHDLVSVLPEHVPGSAILARLASDRCRVRDDLVGSDNRAGGSGGQLGIFIELGSEFLKTSITRGYPTADVALECEWNDELLRQRLGIYHPGRVWFLSRGADAQFWACSLTPSLPSLRQRFNARPAGPDRETWELYLRAFRMSFELAQTESILLDCNPNNFGMAGDRLYYVDDDLAVANGRMPFGHQALLRLREYEHNDLQLRLDFLKGFADLVDEFRNHQRLRDGLLGDLAEKITWPREPALRDALEGLVGRLSPPVKSPR